MLSWTDMARRSLESPDASTAITHSGRLGFRRVSAILVLADRHPWCCREIQSSSRLASICCALHKHEVICCALHKHDVQCLDFRERDARLYVVVRRELRRRSACPCLSPFCGLEEARFCWAAATISSM